VGSGAGPGPGSGSGAGVTGGGGGVFVNKVKVVVVVVPLVGKTNCLILNVTPLSGVNVELLSVLVVGASYPPPVVYVSFSIPVVVL